MHEDGAQGFTAMIASDSSKCECSCTTETCQMLQRPWGSSQTFMSELRVWYWAPRPLLHDNQLSLVQLQLPLQVATFTNHLGSSSFHVLRGCCPPPNLYVAEGCQQMQDTVIAHVRPQRLWYRFCNHRLHAAPWGGIFHNSTWAAASRHLIMHAALQRTINWRRSPAEVRL